MKFNHTSVALGVTTVAAAMVGYCFLLSQLEFVYGCTLIVATFFSFTIGLDIYDHYNPKGEKENAQSS